MTAGRLARVGSTPCTHQRAGYSSWEGLLQIPPKPSALREELSALSFLFFFFFEFYLLFLYSSFLLVIYFIHISV